MGPQHERFKRVRLNDLVPYCVLRCLKMQRNLSAKGFFLLLCSDKAETSIAGPKQLQMRRSVDVGEIISTHVTSPSGLTDIDRSIVPLM